MKKSELKQIIKEEISKVLKENKKLDLDKNGIYILDGGLNKRKEWDEKSLKKAKVLYHTTNVNDPKLKNFKEDGMVQVIIKDNSVEDVIEY
jgi:methionine synthase II (cobalamin-independent)